MNPSFLNFSLHILDIYIIQILKSTGGYLSMLLAMKNRLVNQD
jgi:hypothetical protein